MFRDVFAKEGLGITMFVDPLLSLSREPAWCTIYCLRATNMSYSSAMKLDIEKFDGRIDFDLWKI
jgi:hypothetical protein